MRVRNLGVKNEPVNPVTGTCDSMQMIDLTTATDTQAAGTNMHGGICGGLVGRKYSHAAKRSANWRPGRVYFLTLLEPLAGTTGLRPLPPSRPVSATVSQPKTEVD